MIKKYNLDIQKCGFICFILLLSVVLFARDVLSFSISKWFVLVICALPLLLFKKDFLFLTLSFCLPLLCGIPGTYLILIVLARYTVLEGIKRKTLLYFVFVIVFEALAMIGYKQGLDNSIVSQILSTCLFFLMLMEDDGIDYLSCIRMYWVGTIIVCVIIVCYTLLRAPSNWLELFSKGWFRFGNAKLEDVLPTSMTLRLNSNSLAYFALTGLLHGLVIAAHDKGFSKFITWTGTFFLFIAGFLSVSRSWMLVVLICLVIYALPQVINMRKLLAFSVVILVCVLLMGKLFESNPEFIQGVQTRVTSEDVSGGNGRVEIAMQYLNASMENFRVALIGAGSTYYRTAVDLEAATHNGTLQVFTCYGLIGSIIFCIGMMTPLRNNSQHKSRVVAWLPIIGTVLFIQTIQFINPSYLMYPYVVAVYAIKGDRMKRK